MFVMVPAPPRRPSGSRPCSRPSPDLCDPDQPASVGRCEGARRVQGRRVPLSPAPEDPVLCGISFTAEPGQTTAIVGGTGSGKTTLINLLPRFYDVTSGSVDHRRHRRPADAAGRPVAHHRCRAAERPTCSAAPSRRTCATSDETADDAALWKALETAQATEFVTEMENGLGGEIDQGGTNVSGGQRQRLAIARAIVKRPRVYIFDDSFSALDFKTDQQLRAALRAETRDATVIIVAQRVGTIMHARPDRRPRQRLDRRKGTHDEFDEDLRDIPGDRVQPAEPGGSRMSGPGKDGTIGESVARTAQPVAGASQGGKPAAGPGFGPGGRGRRPGGPMGGGPMHGLMMPAEKAQELPEQHAPPARGDEAGASAPHLRRGARAHQHGRYHLRPQDPGQRDQPAHGRAGGQDARPVPADRHHARAGRRSTPQVRQPAGRPRRRNNRDPRRGRRLRSARRGSTGPHRALPGSGPVSWASWYTMAGVSQRDRLPAPPRTWTSSSPACRSGTSTPTLAATR